MAAKLNTNNAELVRADDDANNNEIGEFIRFGKVLTDNDSMA